MSSEWRRAAAGSRGGLGRVVAMAAALTAGLVLALAGTARGEDPPTPIGLTVVGGDDWQPLNDFSVFWRNSPGAQVSGAGWRFLRPGFLGDVQFTPGADLTELDHLHVPAPGRWELTVWLRDANGLDHRELAAMATLLFDDVAPAVSFMPGDADALPPTLVAAVADPLSGVADGTISYRRLDEERWTDLPTAIRVGALGTELAATTPALKPGTAYLFQAQARDGAGNVGTTTLRADGAPMALRAPDAAGSPGRPAAARRTRLVVRLGGGRGGHQTRTRLTVGPGEGAVLRGRLSGGGSSDDGGGLAGRRLRVVARPARGARGGVEVEPVTTGASGRFELRLPPGPSRRVAVVFAGGDGLRPARRRVALRVRGAVTLRATPQHLRTGGVLLLAGRVGSRGARIPHSGKLVTISYWETATRRWRPVIVTRTDRAGRFRASYRFRYVTGRARIRLRATAPAEADWPYAPGSSRPVALEVTG